MSPTGLFRAILFVVEQLVLRLVHNPLCLPNGQFKFFGQRLIGEAVKKAALQNPSVTLLQNPFVNKGFEL